MSFKSALFILSISLLTGSGLMAQEGILNGKDDYEFAQALGQSRYYDLAGHMAELIASSGGEQQVKGKLLQCMLLQMEAERENDSAKQVELYQQTVDSYKKLAQSSSGLNKLYIQLELGDVFLRQSEYWLAQSQSASASEVPGMLQKVLPLAENARQVFIGLKDITNHAGSRLEKKDDSSTEETRVQHADIRYQAWYGICRSLYFKGMAGRKEAFATCLQELESYLWDYEGKLGSFYAMLLRGMVLHEKQKYRDAIDSFDGVFRPLQEVDHPKAKNLCLQACYYKVRTLTQWRYAEKAIQTSNEFRKTFEKKYRVPFEQEELGQAIMLEVGKAYVSQGEYPPAIDIAQKIAEQRTYWGFMAKKLLQDWGKLNPGALNTAKNAYLVATGLWSQDKYLDAILTFLRVLEYANSPQEIELYTLDSLEKMGLAFWSLRLYQEAALCYRLCAQKYKDYQKIVKTGKEGETQKVSIAAKSSYWAYRGYMESQKLSQDAQDQEQAKQMRDFLLENWPSSGYAYNLSFDKARDEELQAENSKSPEEAVVKYRAAAEAYLAVNPKADLYEKALVYVGKCYYKAGESGIKAAKLQNKNPGSVPLPQPVLGDFTKAEEELNKYGNYVKKNPLTAMEVDRQAQRSESWAHTLYFWGHIYFHQGKSTQAHEKWKELYENYPEQKELVASTLYLLVKMEVANRQLAKAEELLQLLESRYGTNSDMPEVQHYQGFCYYLVGKELLKVAEDLIVAKINKDGKDKWENEVAAPEIFTPYEKAVRYLWEWAARKDAVSATTCNWLASRCMEFGNILTKKDDAEAAKDWYRHSVDLYKRSLAQTADAEKKKDVQNNLATSAIKIGDWEEAVYLVYPWYRQDKDKRTAQLKAEKERAAKGTDSKKIVVPQLDPTYLDYLSQILTGLAEPEFKVRDPEKLYPFLLPHINHDLTDDLREFFSKSNDQSMFEKYKNLKEMIGWIHGESWGDSDKQALDKEFQKEREKWRLNENRNKAEVRYLYRDKYLELLAQTFPENPNQIAQTSITDEKRRQRIQKMCWTMAYESTSTLVESLPRYLKANAHFGLYDNQQWWEVKYRQLNLVYLKGDKQRTRNLIESLELQQKELGGPKYQPKFYELLEKSKRK